ncbi:uncharacterized protein METZ01_LOCUS421437 [marine metagenome]|uniref:Uncharacterized protein n=1 Tax=marine metagenome TaxID=408172 RepID=A0A382XC69_9ZZZZ
MIFENFFGKDPGLPLTGQLEVGYFKKACIIFPILEFAET